MAFRFSGWHRLGIAFSALWLVGCTVYLAFDRHAVFTDTVEAVYDTKGLGQSAAIGQSGTYFDCELTGSGPTPQDMTNIERRTSCRPLWPPVAYLFGIPIALLWTVVPVTSLAFRWIVAGFRR